MREYRDPSLANHACATAAKFPAYEALSEDGQIAEWDCLRTAGKQNRPLAGRPGGGQRFAIRPQTKGRDAQAVATLSATSMLPRVAFEYGQISSARRATASAACWSTPGIVT